MDSRTAPLAGLIRQVPCPVAQVCLWQVDLPDTGHGDTIATVASELNADELARCAALRRPADRLRFAATRAALRMLLAQRLGLPPASLTFAAGERGKPRVDRPDAPAFNVSHAGAYGCIAIADSGDVGVDIERIDAGLGREELGAMAAHCFTPRERAWLRAHDAGEWPQAFHTLWTGKEALLKALGLGIAEHLQHVSVTIGTRGAGHRHAVVCESAQLADHADALAQIRLHELPAPAGYAAAIAWLPPA